MSNICFFCGGFNTNGGIGRVTALIAEELSQTGLYNVSLCSFYESGDKNLYSVKKCDSYILYDKPTSMTRAIVLQNAIGKLIKYFKKSKTDIVVACGALYYPLVLIAAKMCKVKTICWEHISPTITNDYKFQKEARLLGTKYCDCNVVLTRSALDWYHKNAKFKKIIQIYNPVDPMAFKNNSRYNISSKKIVSVGRLSYQKNFDRLIDIANVVLKENPDWVWDIYGEGEMRTALEEKITSYDLNGRLNLKGQVGNIYDYYPDYSLIVMTSRYEGFPMVLLEAAAFKLPMISFDISTGPNEIISNGVNGYLCNADSDLEMISSIQKVITDPELKANLSENSYVTANRFAMQEIMNQWIDLFNHL